MCAPLAQKSERVAIVEENFEFLEEVEPKMAFSTLNGIEILKNPKYCQGLAFSIEERQLLGIHGLLPPKVRTQDEQVDNCLRNRK